MAIFISNSPAETEAIGRRVAENVRSGAVLALQGELGSGKTLFTKGFAAAMGSNAAVSSPTFTIVHEYQDGRLPVYHFDFYRIKDEKEAIDIGVEEYFGSGNYCFLEWPEKVLNLLPEETVHLQITNPIGHRNNNSRVINLLRTTIQSNS